MDHKLPFEERVNTLLNRAHMLRDAAPGHTPNVVLSVRYPNRVTVPVVIPSYVFHDGTLIQHVRDSLAAADLRYKKIQDPTWKAPLSSRVNKQLRTLPLAELLTWADRGDPMVDELVRRVQELRATNAQIQSERTKTYDALAASNAKLRNINRRLDDLISARDDGTEHF